jgi:hypothetical protein
MQLGAQQADESSAASATRLSVFAILWGTAVLLHQAAFGRLLAGPLGIALGVAAFALILRPRAGSLLLMVAGLQLAELGVRSPYFSNHWLLAGFVNSTLLLTAMTTWRREGRLDRSAWFESFAPAARLFLLVVYFWGVFHKLNAGFFDPATSCATTLLANFPFDPFLGLFEGEARATASIWTTLIVESAIPICLVFGRTRALGIAVGVCFHFLLGLSDYQPYYNFSSTLFALYWLFVSPQSAKTVAETLAASPAASRVQKQLARYSPNALRFAGALVLGYLLLVLSRGSSSYADNWRYLWVLVGGTCAAFTLANFAAALQHEDSGPGPLLLARPKWILLIPLAYFLNACSPYVGFKTEGVLAMYSNLTTERGVSNHYLLRTPLYLVDYQSDIVEIVKSSDRELQVRADQKRGMTWFEFRDYLHTKPGASVSYRRHGTLHELSRVGSAPDFSAPTPWFARKWLLFRDVELGPSTRCTH